jgi:hypothetical protein
MERRVRILAVFLLCVSSLGVGIQYESTTFRSYPERADIVTDPVGSDGEQVLLFASVVSVNEQAGELTVSLAEKEVTGVGLNGIVAVTETHEITVLSVDPEVLAAVEPGASVQVYGTLGEESTVLTAENTVVDYDGSNDWRYVSGTSLLGALLAVGYFLRHWTVDWRQMCFQQRGES